MSVQRRQSSRSQHFRRIMQAGAFITLAGFAGTLQPASATNGAGDGTANIVPVIDAQFFQDLYFGIIVPDDTAASTVKVLRGSNNSSVCGAGLTCLENGNRARIRITGQPGAHFTLTDPGSTTLSDGNGNTMLVDSFVGGGSGNNNSYGKIVRLKANGESTLNIGATLHIAANQPPGAYAGTYTVTASYE